MTSPHMAAITHSQPLRSLDGLQVSLHLVRLTLTTSEFVVCKDMLDLTDQSLLQELRDMCLLSEQDKI
jgi:hypothetical protein